MSEFPAELLPSRLFAMKSAPVLWIGAGLSKRFVDGFQTWDDLLADAASKLGIDHDRFIAMSMQARDEINDLNPSEDIVSSSLASKISKMYIDGFSDGSLKPSDYFSDGDLDQYRHGVDPLKLIVCASMRSLRFRDDRANEIESFKRLIYSVPAVITTNYDTVIETLFDDKFKTYNSVDEYYRSSEIGIGEIHKIHGTIRMPRSIVLTKKDYELFESRSAIISSKIVTLMCDAPLLIMGYSMNDRMIRDIIGQMFKSFSKEMADQISKNIIYLNYIKGSEPMRGTMQIECNTGLFHIQTLMIDSLLPIFEDIGRYAQRFTIPQMRMLRKMLVDAVPFSTQEGQNRLAYVGIESIDDVDPERTVVALTTQTTMDTMKSFKRYSVDDISKDVLDGVRLTPALIIDIWFEGNEQQSNVFSPIFDYLMKLGRDESDYSEKLIHFIDGKRNQYIKFFDIYAGSFRDVTDKTSMDAMMRDQNRKFKRADLIAYAYGKHIINRAETMEMLKVQYERAMADTGKTNTSIRRAITLPGFMEFMKN